MLITPLLLCGCGYDSGGGSGAASSDNAYHWSSLYRQDVKTVAVPIFTTNVFSRGVEFRLTKAVVNQLEANTPYKVVPRERAETVLEAEIIRVEVSTVSQDFTNSLPQEQIVNVVVNFTWKDQRNGKMLCERRNFQAAATYYPTLGEDRFVGRQLATERLALSMVQELQADW
jgi:hypothetical protein